MIQKKFHCESSKNITLQFEMDIDRELGAVVFDEVHYIGDQDGVRYGNNLFYFYLHKYN